MVYLIYGILKGPPLPGTYGDLTGVRGKPVIFIEAHALCAAVSAMELEEVAPPVVELLAYAQVVETIHRRQTVVPMRYGCFLNGLPGVLDVLKERQLQYETLLAELDGHVEMGIRIFLQRKEDEKIPAEGTTLLNEKSATNGRAYLALRKVHYLMQEETSQDRQALIDRYLQEFSGLYARHSTETETKNGAVILSFYFLIPKSAVNRFRETFGDMMAMGNDEARLSGPWPPYNFVTDYIGKLGDTISKPLSS
jgi:hypothetical protein